MSNPERTRRWLLEQVETSLKTREVGTILLEVRIGNESAQNLYRRAGYTIVQRISKYYNNGEDGFLMMKSLY